MNEMLLLAELLEKHRLETQEKDKRIAELEKEEEKNERTIKNMGLAIALAQEWTKEKDDKIAELENSWISVEDGLPDELQSVLSFASRDGVSQSIYRAGNFKKSLVVWEHLNVTHWMPLPEPPKEQVK